MKNQKGFVSFVGAGPGDIGLITQKGMQCIERADVILYDRLVNPRLLRSAKATCEFVYCGKLPKNHIMRQEKINEMLVQLAEQGQYVVRLKGGDPSVFGRVGEEAEELGKHGILYDIVPGITSSIAAATYAGIPITHRDYSNSFTLRTGHYCANNERADSKGQQMGDTIAYYMGIKNLNINCKRLIEQGKPSKTKVAIIQWATLGKQKVVEGTLETIADIVNEENIENPAMMIVGDVVSLRESLAWFDKKRLNGKRVIIAKSTAGDFELESYFSAQGAEAYSFPILQKKERKFTENELTMIVNSKRLAFATPDSVVILLEQLMEAGYDIRDLPRNIACRSDKTKKVLAERGIIADKLKGSDESMVMIAPTNDKVIGLNVDLYFSHEILVDQRFNEINERMLKEDEWATVIFPNKAAVDSYVNELVNLNIEHMQNINFAYIGESVKEYANRFGFSTIDEEIQCQLDCNEWRRSQ
ncbi:uroporphyrinogen-III C-methyltransferase [Lederbergia lenta]|uniref:Uroporphyrinogen-III C-methyltransferase n=1 Tax=Lederbergia lenta TaxID=1467 RepID=A0A2X4VZX1_LEDLE|nr:uroporphyrinogen-III C-methyltransferase [Lederbergia lenta]MEC2326011.1 uroporphyrinogen-III C-methyltransferase [Lederbergia lenta]SQI53368.1 uroporphyrin-III C-methyltransferase [Lederbergia lenta]